MPEATSFSAPSFERNGISRDLYLARGGTDAGIRCEVNRTLGDFDLLAELVNSLELAEGQVVYDVGCGSGSHLAHFATCVGDTGRALGFDFSPEAVAACRERGLEAIVADGADLPVASSAADALTCNYAVYYLDDLAAALAEWARVLAPSGRLVVSGPARDTNRELYDFHRRALEAEPSDADLMALGYVAGPVRDCLPAAGFSRIGVRTATNRVRFPDGDTFLAYWRATSLFARTPEADFAKGEALLAGNREPFTVTKRVSILTAVLE